MAVVQSTYAAVPTFGYPGMVANGETSNRISRTVEDVAGIAFGKAAFRGVNDHGVTATPTVGTLMGFVIADKSMSPIATGPANEDIVPRYSTAGLMTLGTIWVTAGEAVTDGAQVYITAGGAIVDTVGSNIIAPGWFFDDTAATGAPVRITRR